MHMVQAGHLVRPGAAGRVLALMALLGALTATVGLGLAGWVAGTACGLVLNALLARGLARRSTGGLGPADRVTLTRATLACGVAALTADPVDGPARLRTLVALSVVALLLDAVDGRVARRTGTVSTLGARFDMEADAFLILVLSVYVEPAVGAWVLAIGGARYAFGLAGWMWPWLRAPLPPRYWSKVVAATQGVVLTCAAADALPARWTVLLLAGALVLLAESFGHQVRALWRLRSARSNVLVAVAPWRG